jgi:hypothetical protein
MEAAWLQRRGELAWLHQHDDCQHVSEPVAQLTHLILQLAHSSSALGQPLGCLMQRSQHARNHD